jgi:hypothetical protein
MLTRRMAREIGRLGNAREQLFAMLRAYIDHGVENPALYSLMFGGYLTGPNHGRPAIELAEAEKTKALLAGVIAAGWSGTGHSGYQRAEDCGRDPGVQGMLDGLAAELPILPPGTWIGPQLSH